jgi:peptide/nickel transport system permease protein
MRNVARRIAARSAEAGVSLALLVTMVFFLAHSAPGGPAYAILGFKARPASVDAVDFQLGLDVPLWHQFVIWWAHVLHFSLGNSFLLNRPVAGLLADYAGPTLALQGAGFLLGLLLALVLGLAHGAWFRAWPGRVLGAVELLLYATPGFVIGTILVLACAGWLPPGGVADLRQEAPRVGDLARHLVLPALTMALVVYAGLARFFAESVDASLARPFARTAAAKGLGFSAVLLRHAAPNAVRPLITVVGLSLPGLFAAGIVVESVFSYPGLGWLLWRSAVAQDYPVLVGIVLLVGVVTILGNLLAELLNAALDPRLHE